MSALQLTDVFNNLALAFFLFRCFSTFMRIARFCYLRALARSFSQFGRRYIEEPTIIRVKGDLMNSRPTLIKQNSIEATKQ